MEETLQLPTLLRTWRTEGIMVTALEEVAMLVEVAEVVMLVGVAEGATLVEVAAKLYRDSALA
ncbi:hypothetical protein PHMEG_00038230 [Phytophthora megakarya]|uniref:Uncharacterized protein n=1 Tax=Phytophthora megakarya TaxID=4795 RepID=A0A225UI93_9STRA|nr:hypothetical protein PHMEG_00038230 [Phytophthora megakarya]